MIGQHRKEWRISMNRLESLNIKVTHFVLGAKSATDTGSIIVESIQWLITGGGLLMAVWGIVQLTQSGRNNDSTGKMEATWLLIGGILLMAIGAGTLITGVFDNPPGS